MSAAKDVAAKVAGIVEPRLKDAPSSVPESLPDQGDPVAVLVQSTLMWNAGTEKAAAAYEKIRKSFVDWNELRVSMADEVVGVIGPRYPEADERCRRLRAMLRNLYLREHEMSFASAEAAGKRSIRKYLESLQGMLPYVAERTLLVAFGGHALPVDEPLRLRLVEAGVIEPDEDAAAASAVMLRHVKASDALRTHLALQAWIDEVGPPRESAARSSKSGVKGSGRKTSPKKTSSRKTTSKKTTSRTTAARTTTAKKTPSKKTPSKKTPSKKTATKKAPSKKTARTTTAAARKTKAAGTRKKSTARKNAGRRTAAGG